jgi:RNA polymerase sigma factor (sigma-70 family)
MTDKRSAPPLSWRALIERLPAEDGRSGGRDEEAWREFSARVRRLAALSLRWQRGLLFEDIEDITQDVLTRFLALDEIERLRAAREPASYLVTVLRNQARNLARQRGRREVRDEAFETERWLEGEKGGSEGAEPEVRAIRALLREIDEDDRELLRERFWVGKSIAEIAAMRGVPYSTVAVRLFRLYRELRNRLTPPLP